MPTYLQRARDRALREYRARTSRDLRFGDVQREFGAPVAADAVSASVLVEALIVDPRFPGLPSVDYKVSDADAVLEPML